MNPNNLTLGALGRFGGALGVLLGSLGSLLGRSWGAVGGSEPPRGCPRAILERHFEQSDLALIFGSILSAKRMPKGRHLGGHKGAKMASKMIPKRSKSEVDV